MHGACGPRSSYYSIGKERIECMYIMRERNKGTYMIDQSENLETNHTIS
jgi:hypothetical protein